MSRANKKFQCYRPINDTWPPIFCVGVRANGKMAQKGSKHDKNGLKTHPKVVNAYKTKGNPIFLGDVGLIKVVSEFPLGHPK